MCGMHPVIALLVHLITMVIAGATLFAVALYIG